ncbi:MAG: DUF1772 domain-containing protein [Williamsia sp.]|nr:DUF1772 domain-containing protein [Williamsia sp.]
MTTTSVCLLLFILNLAIATGAGLYEVRIVLPLWFVPQPDSGYAVDTAAMQKTDVGRRFWGMVTTLPLSLLTLINLVYSLTVDAPLNLWWLCGSLLILAERLATFLFFIPKAIVLQSDNHLSANDKSRLAARWLRLNYVRNTVTAIGLLLCVKAFLSFAV